MRRRILVVEDDSGILPLLIEILDHVGYDARGVAHPTLVLDVARRYQPDLALIDVMLPGRSGIAIAEELRAHEFAGTPMIAMSASPSMLKLADYSGQFQATLDKPFEIDAFIETIERVMAAEHVPEAPPCGWSRP